MYNAMQSNKKVKLKFPSFSFIIGRKAKTAQAEKIETMVKGGWTFIYSTLFRHEPLPGEEVAASRQLLRSYFKRHSTDLKQAFVLLVENTVYYHLRRSNLPFRLSVSPSELLEPDNISGIHFAAELAYPQFIPRKSQYFRDALRVLCKAAYWQAVDGDSFKPDDWRRLLLNYHHTHLYDLLLFYMVHTQNEFAGIVSLKK
jgi:hypothetical protein